MKKYIFDYTNVSSFHGLCHINPKSRTVFNIFWFLITVGGTCLTVVFFLSTASLYISKQMSTDLRFHTQSSMQLPDVVICTTNRYNQTKIKQLNISDELIKAMHVSVPMNPSFVPFWSIPTEDELDMIRPEYDQLIRKFNSYEQLIYHLLAKCEDIIDGCGEFSETDCCKTAEATEVVSGTCVRIKGETQLTAEIGMRIRLRFPKDEELTLNPWALVVSRSYLVQLVKDTEPYTFEGSGRMQSVNRGEHTILNLRLTTTKSIPNPPHYICEPQLPANFSKTDCFLHCEKEFYKIQANETKPCQFLGKGKPVGMQYPPGECDLYAFVNERRSFVNALDQPTPEKRNSIQKTIADRYSQCMHEKCPQACVTNTYSIDKQTLAFDRIMYEKLLLGDSDKVDEVMNYRGVLDVKFKELAITQIEQRLSLTLMDVVANFGGYMGLFLGGSLISILHLFVYFIENLFSPPEKYENKSEGNRKINTESF